MPRVCLSFMLLIHVLYDPALVLGGRNVKKALDGDVCQRMWDADNHRFLYGKDYTLSLQGKTTWKFRGDRAQQSLFQNVNEAKLLSIPTFKNLIELLDNYKLKTGEIEVRSPERIKEEIEFIGSVLNTGPMKIAQQYLQGKTLENISNNVFKEELLEMWFNLYQRGRGGAYGESSGFEHVFVGELTKGKQKQNWKVGGLHNWVAFYLQEKKGQADYRGYYTVLPAQIGNLNRGQGYQNKEPVNAVVKFIWHKSLKPKGGFFIGTSPEFELALYTLCFKIHPGKLCTCKVGQQEIKVQTYKQRGTPYVATAFPMV